MPEHRSPHALEFHPVTADRWSDLERLFGERGACGGCWCMWWRLERARFEKQKGAENRRAMRRIVVAGEVPGVLAYSGEEPIGWCALGPRETYSRLSRSRVLAPVDADPVWSVVCFFVARPFRKRGVTVRLLEAAAEHARARGARILEGYPIEPRHGKVPDAFAYHGLPSAFRAAGFEEICRRSDSRPIMRRRLEARPSRPRG